MGTLHSHTNCGGALPPHCNGYSGSTAIEQMAEKIMTEQLLNIMPAELQVWVRERKPATAVEVGDNVQVRRTAVDPSKEAIEGTLMRDPAAPPTRDALPVGNRAT